jgi:hypothetical protein
VGPFARVTDLGLCLQWPPLEPPGHRHSPHVRGQNHGHEEQELASGVCAAKDGPRRPYGQVRLYVGTVFKTAAVAGRSADGGSDCRNAARTRRPSHFDVAATRRTHHETPGPIWGADAARRAAPSPTAV